MLFSLATFNCSFCLPRSTIRRSSLLDPPVCDSFNLFTPLYLLTLEALLAVNVLHLPLRSQLDCHSRFAFVLPHCRSPHQHPHVPVCSSPVCHPGFLTPFSLRSRPLASTSSCSCFCANGIINPPPFVVSMVLHIGPSLMLFFLIKSILQLPLGCRTPCYRPFLFYYPFPLFPFPTPVYVSSCPPWHVHSTPAGLFPSPLATLFRFLPHGRRLFLSLNLSSAQFLLLHYWPRIRHSPSSCLWSSIHLTLYAPPLVPL